MSLIDKDKLLYIYWSTGLWTDVVYDELINVEPVRSPFNKRKKKTRHFLRTRRWMKAKDIIIEDRDWEPFIISWWKITDVKEWEWRDVIMWVNNAETELILFRECIPCKYTEIYRWWFCKWQSDKIYIFDFVKWKPRYNYIDTTTWNLYHPSTECNWIQINEATSTSNISPSIWYFESEVVNSSSQYAWNTWTDWVQSWDYIYSYWSCNSDWFSPCNGFENNGVQPWVCWVVNRVWCIQWKKISVENLWSWFNPWVLDYTKYDDIKNYQSLFWSNAVLPSSFYTVPPQTAWYWVNFLVFPEYWPVIWVVSEWAFTTIHYVEELSQCFTSYSTALPSCNFKWCYWDIVNYVWRWWNNQNIFFDYNNNVALYSLPWSWGMYIEDTIPLKSWTKSATYFNNFALYFGERHIGAFYIDIGTNWYYSNGNIIRNNYWVRTNSDWRQQAYDEFMDNFFFIWSDKSLNILSLATNDWRIISKIDSAMDSRASPIYWELDRLEEWDDVYLQATDDQFRIFIKKNWNETNTSIQLRYYKNEKIWVKWTMCCWYVNFEYKWMYIWDAIYHLCWDKDCSNTPIKTEISRNIWEDEQQQNKVMLMNYKLLNFTDILFGKNTKLTTDTTKLYLTKHFWTIKSTLELWWFDSLPYFNIKNAIDNWEKVWISDCIKNKLSSCEYVKDYNRWNIKPTNEVDDWCECAYNDDKWDFCFEYDDKYFFLSDFVNVHIKHSWDKWYLFQYKLTSEDIIEFWWFIVWYWELPAVDSWDDCHTIKCDCSNKDTICCSPDTKYNSCS